MEQLEDRNAPAITGTVTHDFVTYGVFIEHIAGFAHVIDPTATSWLVIHGRNDSAAGELNLAESIQKARPNDQVLLLDWSGPAASGLGLTGEAWIVPVAAWAENALAANGFAGSRLNIVGHSWGAYLGEELAARFGSTGVNSIVALDPPFHIPLDFEYNPEDGHVNFAAHAGFSWAFRARELTGFLPVGSFVTPQTANEDFTVEGADHQSVIDVFRDLLERSTAVSQFFTLDRLMNHQPLSWLHDRFTFLGTLGFLFPGLRVFEAALGTEANPDPTSTIHREATSVEFFDAANPNAAVPNIVVANESANLPPVIGFVSAPQSIKQGKRLIVTASVFDAGTSPDVQFFFDTNGDGVLDAGDALLGTGARSGEDWTLIIPTTGWALGNTRIFVKAFDDATPTLARVQEVDLTVVALPPAPHELLATGTDFGGDPLVNLYNPVTGQRFSFQAYDLTFKGGVRVATGDVNGDGVDDLIVGAGPTGGPHIRVFDGVTHAQIRSFFAFDPSFTGGVWVAAGDLNNDGFADIIVGEDAGGQPRVRVFSGKDNSLLADFLAYGPGFTGGVRVASGDVNGDGVADLIMAAGPGGGPHVRAISGANGLDLASFFVYAPTFTGGIFIAAGDTNGDGIDDYITGAGASGGPHVKVISGATQSELMSFFAADPSFTGGVRIAAVDFDGDGLADVATSLGPLGNPVVKIFKGNTQTLIKTIQAYDPSFLGGVFVG
jgi:pimeloyl-ACP methyl ester carboxylesterase